MSLYTFRRAHPRRRWRRRLLTPQRRNQQRNHHHGCSGACRSAGVVRQGPVGLNNHIRQHRAGSQIGYDVSGMVSEGEGGALAEVRRALVIAASSQARSSIDGQRLRSPGGLGWQEGWRANAAAANAAPRLRALGRVVTARSQAL
ncbi:hypothetical protein BP5796_00272 [Coleophoma crateriformis]|uniref:Uncharacterized protein n=1 Tax=Coleophoma crateriformis TaxID=565419 RepID=A0A3D8T7I3_9HELO|nr:hypothetical protein BP5796_00272 [Coleophoma crateriformis]